MSVEMPVEVSVEMPEPDPEVVGIPGLVRAMIGRFSCHDSGVVTNGYTRFKGYTPKSKPITTSSVKSPTSPRYSTLRISQPKSQNSDSVNYDQNGGRLAARSGSELRESRTPSRTSQQKSSATYGWNLSEVKVMQSSKSTTIEPSSNGNQVFCDTSVNKGSPLSPRLNGSWNPDDNRTKGLPAYNTEVENWRNARMGNSTITMERLENQMEHSSTSVEKSKAQTENSTAPVKNSTNVTQYCTATVENSDISSTPVENSKVSFTNKVTICLSPTPRSFSVVSPRSPSHSSQLHSIQYSEPALSGSTDVSRDLACNNSSTNNNKEPTAEMKECNFQFIETRLQENDSINLNAEKDGRYFVGLVAQVESDLKKNCAELEGFLKESIPDEASGKIRAAIGKTNLLMTKKFKQFRELCNNNLTQSRDDQFQTTSEDLTGYWDLVQLQVDEVQRLFQDINTLQSNNWIESEPQIVIAPLSPKATEVRPKGQTQSTKNPRSSKVSDSSKAREESRKRLMAAKMAGRQRKTSETEDEIQIFIS